MMKSVLSVLVLAALVANCAAFYGFNSFSYGFPGLYNGLYSGGLYNGLGLYSGGLYNGLGLYNNFGLYGGYPYSGIGYGKSSFCLWGKNMVMWEFEPRPQPAVWINLFVRGI